MKVFIGWSGSQSKELAEGIRDWIPVVLQAVAPYFTPADIEKGTRWSNDISKELENSSVGILCITRENIRAPWIMFEAGALSKSLDKSHVCPILFGVSATDIEGPLKQFQCTAFEKADVKQLITTINGRLQEGRLAQKILETVFERWWPDLLDKVAAILGMDDAPAEPIRSDRELLEEVLLLTRSATSSSRDTSVNPRALIDIAESLIEIHDQQVQRQGSYQDALDLLRPIHISIRYLLRHVRKEGDGMMICLQSSRDLNLPLRSNQGNLRKPVLDYLQSRLLMWSFLFELTSPRVASRSGKMLKCSRQCAEDSSCSDLERFVPQYSFSLHLSQCSN